MSYTTVKNVQDRFGRDSIVALTGENEQGKIDSAAVRAAIADAENIINSYIQNVVALPFSKERAEDEIDEGVPPLISTLTDTMAFIVLNKYRNKNPSDYLKNLKSDMEETLMKIAMNKLSLGLNSDGDEEEGRRQLIESVDWKSEDDEDAPFAVSKTRYIR